MCSKTTVRHFCCTKSHMAIQKPRSQPHRAQLWDALDNRIRNRRVQPRARQELEIVLHVELLTIQDSTLHISNEETLPSMHCAAKGDINCKFDEK